MTDLAGMGSAGPAEGAAAGAAAAAAPVEDGLASAVSPLGSTALSGVVSSGLGQASSVGALSVPYGWTTAAPQIKLATEALPSNGLGAAPAAAETDGIVFGEMALASMAGRAVSGTAVGARKSSGAAGRDRPLPIVIVKPPHSTTGRS